MRFSCSNGSFVSNLLRQLYLAVGAWPRRRSTMKDLQATSNSRRFYGPYFFNKKNVKPRIVCSFPFLFPETIQLLTFQILKSKSWTNEPSFRNLELRSATLHSGGGAFAKHEFLICIYFNPGVINRHPHFFLLSIIIWICSVCSDFTLKLRNDFFLASNGLRDSTQSADSEPSPRAANRRHFPSLNPFCCCFRKCNDQATGLQPKWRSVIISSAVKCIKYINIHRCMCRLVSNFGPQWPPNDGRWLVFPDQIFVAVSFPPLHQQCGSSSVEIDRLKAFKR